MVDPKDNAWTAANKLGGQKQAEYKARKSQENAAKQAEQEKKHQAELQQRSKDEGLL
ncbi:MAG TPA: hypothetical protein VGM08_04375 [Candidatus Saccharimonadales bacterium]|jgi:hypothetical protein